MSGKGVPETERARLRRLFTAVLDAIGSKDFDRLESLLTDDVLCEWPYRPLPDMAETMVGNRAFRAFCEDGMRPFDPYRHTATAFYDLVEPDALIAEYYSDTVYHPNGRRYSNRYLGIVRFRGEQINYWKEYINPLTVKETLGI